MPKYIVEVTFHFPGTFTIEAESPEQAQEYAEKHCGLVIGGDIHSTLPDDEVSWDFATHPQKEIGEAIADNSFGRFSSEEELAQAWLSNEACGAGDVINEYPFMAEYIDLKKIFEEASNHLRIEREPDGTLNASFFDVEDED